MAEQDISPAIIDPWERARKAVKSLGDISTSFTSCTRALLGDGRTATGSKFTFMGRQHLERLLRSPTVVSHLYYAAQTYHKADLEKLGFYTPLEMIEVFSAAELASLLTILYFHRRLCARFVEKKEWSDLSTTMQLYLDLAVPLGQTIPSIGPMRALLTGASRYLGWGAIASQDPKGFKKYKVASKVKGKLFLLQEELDNWGTTHVHIAASMYQSFGFGIEVSSGFLDGLIEKDLAKLDGEKIRFRVAQLWLDSLVHERDVPKESLGDDFAISDGKIESFVDGVHALLEKGSEHSWLDKRRTDISAEITPSLKFQYKKFNKSSPDADALDDEMESPDSA